MFRSDITSSPKDCPFISNAAFANLTFTIVSSGETAEFDINPYKKTCLTNGYDEDDGYHKGVDAVYDHLKELLYEHDVNVDKLIR